MSSFFFQFWKLKLSAENERIRKKYKKLARKNGQLEKELNDFKEQFRKNEFMQTVTRRYKNTNNNDNNNNINNNHDNNNNNDNILETYNVGISRDP